jgi:hypothetical protein
VGFRAAVAPKPIAVSGEANPDDDLAPLPANLPAIGRRISAVETNDLLSLVRLRREERATDHSAFGRVRQWRTFYVEDALPDLREYTLEVGLRAAPEIDT